MKKVLYIVYYYPPVGGSGVQRGAKFCKYLPDYAWDSVVLTSHPKWVKHPQDPGLLSDVRAKQVVYHAFTLDAHWLYKVFWGLRLPKVVTWLMFHVFTPDAEIIWLPFAKLSVKKILREHKIDLVFISGPPFSPMLLGNWIKNRFNIPYVVDFRDDWSIGQSRQDNPPPPRFSAYERKLEKKVLSEASKIVVVNKAYRQDFMCLYPEISESKYEVITNGYDEDDFKQSSFESGVATEIMQIAHPGVLFARRHPGTIWQALINLSAKCLIDPHKIRIHIYGKNFASFVFKGFENNPIIQEIVVLHPYLTHPQVISTLLQSDALLLFSGPGKNSEAELPGKLFEYLRAGKPILAVVHPEGVCAEVLRECGHQYIASPNDLRAIEAIILDVYHNWYEQRPIAPKDVDLIRIYERRELSKKLANVFTSLADKNNAP